MSEQFDCDDSETEALYEEHAWRQTQVLRAKAEYAEAAETLFQKLTVMDVAYQAALPSESDYEAVEYVVSTARERFATAITNLELAHAKVVEFEEKYFSKK